MLCTVFLPLKADTITSTSEMRRVTPGAHGQAGLGPRAPKLSGLLCCHAAQVAWPPVLADL